MRGAAEREDGRKLLQLALHQRFGDQQLFVINAFALGPWATGMTVSMSIVDVSVLKSTGPTSRRSSTRSGASARATCTSSADPPFLKQLVDSDEIDLSGYDVVAAVGGEGLSESLGLLRSFKVVLVVRRR